MQDLKALEGKSLVELREIAKAIGIGDTTLKKRELIEKIAGSSASESTPAENKEKRGRGRKKEAPATEMQQTAPAAEPAAAKAETAPETVPQAPAQPPAAHHQYEDRKHRSGTASARNGRRPPRRAGASDGKRPGTCTSGSGRSRTGTPRGEGGAQAPRPQAQGTGTGTGTGRGSRTRRRDTPGLPRQPRLPRQQQPMRNPSTAR